METTSDSPLVTEDQLAHAEVLCSGPAFDLTEAESLKFIREHTHIPVPKVLNSYEKDGFGYILMEFVEGKILENVWATLPPNSKHIILSELRDYIRQMRQIKLPTDVRIGSVTGGPAVDRRVMGPVRGGPFESEKEFNAWQLDQLKPGVALVNRDIYVAMHRSDHEIVFSHGDLGFHNILVHDGHVSAIIDWRDAGWFPAHWDFCKSAGHLSGTDDLYLALRQIYYSQYLAEFFMDTWFNRKVRHGGF